MMTDDGDLEALVAAIAGTGKKLEDTKLIYAHINANIRKMRIIMWIGFIGLLLDLTLSLAFGFILHNQDSLNSNQDSLNSRVNENQTAIHKAECDLNTVLIAADTPEQRDKAPSTALYDSWYETIYESRVELGCRPPLLNPRHP